MATLAIGMAVIDDYKGLWHTIITLRKYFDVSQIELVVVNNAPTTDNGKVTEQFVRYKCPGFRAVKYVPLGMRVGTSQPRNVIFAAAESDFVLVLDSHVHLHPPALTYLQQFIDENPNCDDLISGPLEFDTRTFAKDGGGITTHFNAQWRDSMWGTWGQAWRCNCPDQRDYPGLRFSVIDLPDGKTRQAVTLDLDMVPVSLCGNCGKSLPADPTEANLIKADYIRLGVIDEDEPFEIPAMGLGLFCARRESWLQFNIHTYGFGAEECNIHALYKQHGRCSMCHPMLKWVHRFGKTDEKMPYQALTVDKVGNYLLWDNQLGRDTIATYNEFVGNGRISELQWQHLLENPGRVDRTLSAAKQSDGAMTLPLLYEKLRTTPRDLNEHFNALAALADGAECVTEIGKRNESTAAFASASPKRLISHNLEMDSPNGKLLADLLRQTSIQFAPYRVWPGSFDIISNTDVLFLDSQHTHKRLSFELTTYAPKVSRFIAIHDTVLHGNRGEDGQKGLIEAIKDFLAANPKWFVYSHTNTQYGLTVLGVQPADKPEKTVWLWPPGKGVGTELKKMLAVIGIVPTANCKCNSRAIKMDKEGPDWCLENLATIVEWLREEATNRKMPFVDLAAKIMVKRAIKKARVAA